MFNIQHLIQHTTDPFNSTYFDNAIISKSDTISDTSGRLVGSTCNILSKRRGKKVYRLS